MIVLAGRGPLGSGMEETYQLTSALKFLPFGRHVGLITDARFSGVSTGACIGYFSPEALEENFRAVLDELQRAKPASAKGRYLRKITVSSTMGPGVKVDINRLRPDTV